MDGLRWFNGDGGGGSFGAARDAFDAIGHGGMLWAWVTMVLSAVVAAGYCAIAVNWFFQSKLARHAESRAALGRLRNICLACAACGLVFYTVQTPFFVWRIYDAGLLLLGLHAWSFVLRTRGPGLMTERLARVDELERSATKYREIAELLPHMVWTATDTGRVDFSNQRWREYAGDGVTWLDALPPEEAPRVLDQWHDALASHRPVYIEARLMGLGGASRTFVIRATPIANGDAIKWLGACADIEDQRLLAAEKEMQARQKSFFLNALSHDLRAPLHNVLLNAHLLKMSVSDEADAESVEMIVENAMAAGDLVTKLLDFAKVGAQDHNDVERVSLGALLNQVVRRFLPRAEQRGLYLKPADPDADAHVLTDRLKLERIVSNLVDNAIKYTSAGGVTLELHACGDGGEVSIRVRDTGVGVAPEHAPHLFDEFYQVNNYERDRSKGFGMGLAICRSLARHIGGDVRLAGTGAGGSCFEIVVRNAPAGPAPGAGGDDGVGGGAEVGADRGGRPGRADGDHQAAETTGLCGV